MTGTRVAVRLTPRAGSDRIDGVLAGRLRVRVAAAPADGAANAALCHLLAADLGIAPSHVRVERGAASRHKVVTIEGVSPDRIAARWPGLAG